MIFFISVVFIERKEIYTIFVTCFEEMPAVVISNITQSEMVSHWVSINITSSLLNRPSKGSPTAVTVLMLPKQTCYHEIKKKKKCIFRT